MSSQSLNVYVFFYTYLFDELDYNNLDGIKHESCCASCTCALLNTDFFVYTTTRLTNYYAGPFIHVKIGFKESTYFKVFSVNRGANIHMRNGTYTHRRGFSILTLKVKKEQYDSLYNLCNEMLVIGQDAKFSSFKMSGISGSCRDLLFLSPLELPTKDTKKWFCSEFVAFLLIESKIIPYEFHPSYISATDLFLYLVKKNNIVRGQQLLYSYDYMNKELCFEAKMTNSIEAYCFLKKCTEPNIPSVDRKKCLAFKLITQFSVCVFPEVLVSVQPESEVRIPVRYLPR